MRTPRKVISHFRCTRVKVFGFNFFFFLHFCCPHFVIVCCTWPTNTWSSSDWRRDNLVVFIDHIVRKKNRRAVHSLLLSWFKCDDAVDMLTLLLLLAVRLADWLAAVLCYFYNVLFVATAVRHWRKCLDQIRASKCKFIHQKLENCTPSERGLLYFRITRVVPENPNKNSPKKNSWYSSSEKYSSKKLYGFYSWEVWFLIY